MTEDLSKKQIQEYVAALHLAIEAIEKRYKWTWLGVALLAVSGLGSVGYGAYNHYVLHGEPFICFLNYVLGIMNLWFAHSGITTIEKSMQSVSEWKREIEYLTKQED